MANRYDGSEYEINELEMYHEHFEKRGIKHIIQFKTFNMRHPSAEQIQNLDTVGHIWSLGDKFYKLAYEHYGDSRWWWVIAWFNETPTESHVALGQVVNVPHPLDRVLTYMRSDND